MPKYGADYEFDLDLPKGQIAEEMLAKVLCGEDPNVTVEIKRDFLVSKTGNVAIEIESRGKPSGITTSKARWWFFVLSGEEYRDRVIIGISRVRLFQLRKRLQDSGALPVVPGGDNGTSLNELIKVAALVEPLPSKNGQRKLPFVNP